MAFALFLVFLVWFGWMMMQAGNRPRPGNDPMNGNVPANVQPPGNAPSGNGGIHPMPEGAFAHPAVAEAAWTVKTEKYEITFTNRGAAIQTLVIRGILDRTGGRPLEYLQDFHPERLSLSAWDSGFGRSAATTPWEVLEPQGAELARMRFTYPNGLQLTKTFTADPKRYGLGMRITARNLDPKTALSHQLEVLGVGGVAHDREDQAYHLGVYARNIEESRWEITEDLTVDSVRKAAGTTIPGKKAHWGGLTSKYFAAVLAPHRRDQVEAFRYELLLESKVLAAAREKFRAEHGPEAEMPADVELAGPAAGNLSATARLRSEVIEPGMETANEFTIYVGPKRADALDSWRKEFGFDLLLGYGWFSAIANLLLLILNGFHSIFGNYGVAIICLTVLVKVCLFPLTKKAQVSAFKMQQLQPKMMKLREQFEEDKQKLNQEMLKMYKEHGVNPLGGCLPMFFQIPVFIGLYRGLDLSFDLRQQPFMLWIQDLSKPDPLATLPFNIPFLGTNEFHLLPILMTITWFVQSAMMPKSPDPQMAAQQKMFLFMPIVFGFLMYQMPAGLILYWFTSTLLAIGEQRFIKTRYLK